MPKRKISSSVIVARINADKGIEVLLQFKRKYANWEFPGGKLEGNETTKECARRELIEETDINAQTLYYLTQVEGRTFLNIVLWACKWKRTPKLMEPDKHSALGWFPIDALPEPLGWYTATAIKKGMLGKGFEDMVLCEANPIPFRERTPRRGVLKSQAESPKTGYDTGCRFRCTDAASKLNLCVLDHSLVCPTKCLRCKRCEPLIDVTRHMITTADSVMCG